MKRMFSLAIVGVAYLAVVVRQPLAALIAAATFVSYVFLYTPLKRKTPLNTLVGAVPGALPPDLPLDRQQSHRGVQRRHRRRPCVPRGSGQP